jgi:hypothetical protein
MTYVILSVCFVPGLMVVETPSQIKWGRGGVMETTKEIRQFDGEENGLSLLQLDHSMLLRAHTQECSLATGYLRKSSRVQSFLCLLH